MYKEKRKIDPILIGNVSGSTGDRLDGKLDEVKPLKFDLETSRPQKHAVWKDKS